MKSFSRQTWVQALPPHTTCEVPGKPSHLSEPRFPPGPPGEGMNASPLAPRAAGSLEWENPGSLWGENAGSHKETVSLCVWGEDAGYGCSKRDCVESLLPQEARGRRDPDTEQQVRLEGQQGQCPSQ